MALPSFTCPIKMRLTAPFVLSTRLVRCNRSHAISFPDFEGRQIKVNFAQNPPRSMRGNTRDRDRDRPPGMPSLLHLSPHCGYLILFPFVDSIPLPITPPYRPATSYFMHPTIPSPDLFIRMLPKWRLRNFDG